MKKIKQQILKLRKKLRYWEYLYFYKEESKVSDQKYDKTMQELQILEKKRPDLLTPDSPTQILRKIKTKNIFKKAYHKTPMLSLNSVFTSKDVILFDKKIQNKTKKTITYCCELKIDGLGINILYKNGKLIQATTRGDGIIGENVTNNIYTIHDIPKYLNNNFYIPNTIEIRGEIFIQKKDFKKLNKHMKKKENKIFSNTRNAASGSVRQLNSKITAKRPLSFLAYGINEINTTKISLKSHWKQLQIIKKLGIPICKYTKKCKNIQEVLNYYETIIKKRKLINFDIDGIVIKIDSLMIQKQLGFNNRFPHWAIAYKFSSKKTTTKIKNIKFQVGKSGIITPIANLIPVSINGTIIKHANLYNIRKIKELGIMNGDTVFIKKSGEIIPKITKVIIKKRTKKISKIIFPKKCPACNSKIHIEHTSYIMRCNSGIMCIAQKKEKLKHFVSKHAMNIIGIGNKTINKLVDNNLINIPSDLFLLTKNILINNKILSEKLAENFLFSLQNSKKTTFSRFLYSLNIPYVGKITSTHLSGFYKTIDKLIHANINSLMKVPTIGKTSAMYIYQYFHEPNNIRIIQELLSKKTGIYFENSKNFK
ncbi:MAG: DNA ligase [Candidatus Westeberhardia cardiocondylae]|nr:DNA ligase [Candidatus Westeberhardia cardiocondylae]